MTCGMVRVAQAWNDREGPAVFATVDKAGIPNAIYVGEIWLDALDDFVVADNYFCKTRANIQSGTKGAILFLTKNRKSFQVKGSISYHTEGPRFEFMRAHHDAKHPGIAAAVLRIEEAYNGAEKLI
ncbi:MAG TPA: pyridoxamine 5'-phosphate oxidase family protein [Verrucomicrobiota bacterium]|nr:pyridoxamine 5'-phosphate oxidase family protein [Verrucomicrobiota bacterium]